MDLKLNKNSNRVLKSHQKNLRPLFKIIYEHYYNPNKNMKILKIFE